MAVDTRPFRQEKELYPSLCVYKSMSDKVQQWIIVEKNTQPDQITLEFGSIVFAFLNYINSIHPGEDDDAIDMQIHSRLKDKNRNMWKQYFEAMVYFIKNKKNKTVEERKKFCEEYQYLAHYILYGIEFTEGASLPKEERMSFPTIINGYRVINGERYQWLNVLGYQNLFVLDLWELLFNPKAKCSLVQCERCSQIFQTTTKNKHYCAECQQSINYAAEYRKNPVYKLRKNILAKLGNNKKYSRSERKKKLDRFGREYEYYYQIVKFGKTDLPQPENYDPNIKTEKDFLDWLMKWDDEVRIYKRRTQKKRIYLPKDYIQKKYIITRREMETEMETDIEDELIR